jgi:hypothetical protein
MAKSSCPHQFLWRKASNKPYKIGDNAKIARALTEGWWSRGAAVGGAVMQIVAARAAAWRVSAARALAVNNRRPAASAGRPPKAPPLPQPIGRVGAIEYLPLTTQRWISARYFDIAALRRRASHSTRQQTKTPFVFIISAAAANPFPLSKRVLMRAHRLGSNPGASCSGAIGPKKSISGIWDHSQLDCDTRAAV